DLRGGPARGGGLCAEIGGERPERVGVEADRHPARAVREGAAEGVRRRPTDEERWTGRPRPGEERRSVRLDAVRREGAPEDGEGRERIRRGRRRHQRPARRLRPHIAQDDAQLPRSPVRAPPCSVNGLRFLFLGGGGGRERKRSGGGGGPAATFEGAACCAR